MLRLHLKDRRIKFILGACTASILTQVSFLLISRMKLQRLAELSCRRPCLDPKNFCAGSSPPNPRQKPQTTCPTFLPIKLIVQDLLFILIVVLVKLTSKTFAIL